MNAKENQIEEVQEPPMTQVQYRIVGGLVVMLCIAIFNLLFG